MMRFAFLILALFVSTAQALPCDKPGVFVCDSFDDASELAGTLYPGDATPVVEGGMLRFTIPSMSGANAGGWYGVLDWPAVGPGQSLYVAFKVRSDEVTLTSPWPTRKLLNIWRGSSSCTDLEIVDSYKWSGKPFLQPNYNCGAKTFAIPDPANYHNHIFQTGDHDCRYHNTGQPPQDCAISRPDVWEEHYIEITLGDYGKPNSRVVFWQRVDGEWKRYTYRDDATLNGSGPGFHRAMLTVYMTGKKPTEHPVGRVDYDYFVMSRQPFRDALDASVEPPAESTPVPPVTTEPTDCACTCTCACKCPVKPAEPAPEPPTSAAPAWVADLEPGVWTPISLNTMTDVDPKLDPKLNPKAPGNAAWSANSGQMCVIACWNGGALATGYGEHGSLLLYGGGHAGYSGSEVYAFDLSTRLWHRATDPYTGALAPWMDKDPMTPDNKGIYPDGSPLPPHTYSTVGYIPRTNEFYMMRGIYDLLMGSDAANVKRAYFLDLDTKQWRHTEEHTAAALSGGSAVYDEARDLIYQLPSYNMPMTVYDNVTGEYRYGYKMSGIPIDLATAIDPVHDLLVIAAWRSCSTRCPVYIRDLKNLDAPLKEIVQGGEIPVRRGGMGLQWSDRHQGLLYNHGAHISVLTKDSPDPADLNWTWKQISIGDVVPEGTTNSTGTYTRFQVAKYGKEEVAIVVNRNNGPVYAMRLP